jgi:hypothetical protein
MKKYMYWSLAVVITLGAAYYQRTTGPTYPKKVEAIINGQLTELKLVRSLGLDEKAEVKLKITDTTVKAQLFYRRYPTKDEYQSTPFSYKVYPVDSWLMNKVFKIYEEKGFFAAVPQQPPAGKIQYYVEITDSKGITPVLKDKPITIRFKGGVPAIVMIPHILLMFIAMLFSTLAGIMAIGKHPLFRKYTNWTLILFIAGGIVLGPIVQYYAFGALWTGVPFGWDLTDNKTLIAAIFWVLAVIMNRKKERPLYTALAAIVLLLIYSIPHSAFGSELNYESGTVTQGIIMNFFIK